MQEEVRRIATERIERLFELAEARTREGGDSSAKLAIRYIKLAKKISEHYKVKMPKQIKDRICKKCYRVLIPGVTCGVRVASSNSHIAYKCVCGAEKHLHY